MKEDSAQKYRRPIIRTRMAGGIRSFQSWEPKILALKNFLDSLTTRPVDAK